MIRNIYILLLLSLLTIGWGQDCPEGTVFIESPLHYCVPVEFANVNTSLSHAFYYIANLSVNNINITSTTDYWMGVYNDDICVGGAPWDLNL